MKKNEKVWVGVVSHRHGTNVYVGKSPLSLYRQLYEYVKEWWNEIEGDSPLPSVNPTDLESIKEVVLTYFDLNDSEYCDVEQVEVK